MQRLCDRAQRAVADLETRYGQLIGAIAYKLLDNSYEAEEVSQDVLLTVWNSIATFNSGMCYPGQVTLRPWITVITRNAGYDVCRARTHKRKVHPLLQAGGVFDTSWFARRADYSPGILDRMVEAETAALVRAEIAKDHHPKHAKALQLRYEDEMTTHELGEALGVGENTCKVWVYRGKIRAREMLKREGHTLDDVYPSQDGNRI